MDELDAREAVRLVRELSPRQIEVLRGMALGRPTKEIADDLQVSFETVKRYRERVYSRLGVTNLAVAVRVAVMAKVI